MFEEVGSFYPRVLANLAAAKFLLGSTNWAPKLETPRKVSSESGSRLSKIGPPARSDQLRHRLPIVQQVLRPAVGVGDRDRRIDPQHMVERRQNILRRIGAGDRSLPAGIGRSD